MGTQWNQDSVAWVFKKKKWKEKKYSFACLLARNKIKYILSYYNVFV